MIRFLPMLLAVPAFAATISYTASVPAPFNGTPTAANTQTTNWNQSVDLPFFNSALGTLTNVTLTLVGGVFGNAQFESLDAAPATINYSLSAQVTATGIGGLNVVVLPAAAGSFNTTSFDGLIDFGGTSGASFIGLANAASNTTTSSLAAVLAAYTGAGNFSVSMAGQGNSSASGSGNLVTIFSSSAGGMVSVTYEYDAPTGTPEPATFAFVGAGLVAAGLLRRKG